MTYEWLTISPEFRVSEHIQTDYQLKVIKNIQGRWMWMFLGPQPTSIAQGVEDTVEEAIEVGEMFSSAYMVRKKLSL